MSITPSLKQLVNHFEFHSSLSSKLKMFLNMMKYCEETQRNVFNYLPFTYDILNTFARDEYTINLSNFTKIYIQFKAISHLHLSD